MTTYDPRAYLRNLLLATPFILLVPVGFALLARALQSELDLRAILFGAGGWLVALVLRGPIAGLAQAARLDMQVTRRVIILSSGLTEEVVRLGVLSLLGALFDTAYAVGLGWAAIEVLYAIVNGFAVWGLMRSPDPKAAQAREMMETLGVLRASAPFLGVIERISATALHIAFTLLLAHFWPWFIVISIPLHSGLNYALTRYLGRSPVGVQLILLVISLALFLLGLALR